MDSKIKHQILLPLLLVLGIYACDDSNDPSDEVVNNQLENWSDSLLSDLTPQQQYYQHFIFDIPEEFQNQKDSLTNWLIDTQPGGLRFINWDADDLSRLKQRWDTLNIIQPLYCIDYFDYFNLPVYPYWKSNDYLRDSVWFQIFEKDQIGWIDFGDGFQRDTLMTSWLTELKVQTKVRSSVSLFEDNKLERDFIPFLSELKSDIGAIRLRLTKEDSTNFSPYRERAGYKGLLIAETLNSQVNLHLSRGLDLIHVRENPFVFGELPFDKWQVNNETASYFKQSTKRILNYKKELQSNRLASGTKERINSFRTQCLYRSNTLIKNDAQLFPLQNKVLLYASERVRIDKKIQAENQVRPTQVDVNEKLDQLLIKDELKCIVLPDTLSEKSIEAIAAADPFEKTIFFYSNVAHYDRIKDKANVIYSAKNQEGEINWNILVQQMTGRLAFLGNFSDEKSTIKGVKIPKTKLARTSPLFCGLSKDTLRKIDYAVRNAMSGRAFPGCQVLAVKDGHIIYDQSFGHHTYDRQKIVNAESMYDLASLTKVVSTTLMAMKLYENGAFDLTDSLKDFLPDTLRQHLKYPSTIRNIQFQELLIHKSGMPAGFPVLPYMQYTDDEIGRFDKYYCDLPDTVYNIEVAENFYLEECYADSMWLRLNRIWLDQSKPYKYSDVNMNTLYFIFKSIIENDPKNYGFKAPLKELEDKNLYEAYLYREFYKKMEMVNTMYTPRKQVNKDRLVPTENERFWRKQLLQGYVHDPNAALYGGIAGNAGIFSTTNDLAILAQMWLNGGVYNGKRYVKKETVDLFTKAQPDSHRGLGFNKPSMNTSAFGCADSASPQTYGHTGFTGTCIWMDPVNKISFIFLSNRVHPTVNNRIYNYGIRGNAHQYVYDAHLFQEF